MEPTMLEKNYGYECRCCGTSVLLVGLLPSWEDVTRGLGTTVREFCPACDHVILFDRADTDLILTCPTCEAHWYWWCEEE
jgi:hypothetical protein